jgi:hypothetical protein
LLVGGTARAQQGDEPPPNAEPISASASDQQVAEEAPAAEPANGAAPGEAPARPKLEINGFAMLDAIHDFQRVDPNWGGAFRPSRILVDSPLPNGMTTWSVRQSRLNVLGFFPSSLGEITTRFEFDLYGVGPDEGQTTMRVRHVYGEMGSFLFGQTNSLFMDGDTFPNVIDYWGPAGMVFLRTPQARWTAIHKGGRRLSVAIEQPSSAVDSGKIDEIDPTLGVRGRTEWPAFTAQFRQDGPWGHARLSGIVEELGFESATSPNGEPEGKKTGWGVSGGGVFKVTKKGDKIYAEATYGEGISSFMNDGGNDLAPNSSLRAAAVPTFAYMFYFEHPWNARWVSSIGYSEHVQDNQGGQNADAFNRGSYFSANALYTPAPNILLGGEVLWGRRKNNGGADGTDTRIQFSAKYNFSSR